MIGSVTDFLCKTQTPKHTRLHLRHSNGESKEALLGYMQRFVQNLALFLSTAITGGLATCVKNVRLRCCASGSKCLGLKMQVIA